MSTSFPEKAYFFETDGFSVVKCTGQDTRSFLHRMSTQELNALQPGAATLNCFVNQKGRLVELVHHVQVREDEALLLGQSGDGQKLIDWLEQFHFIENISMTDAAADFKRALVFGGKATSVLEAALEDMSRLAPWQAHATGQGFVVRTFDYGAIPQEASAAYLVLLPSNDFAAFSSACFRAGAIEGSPKVLDAARIASGVPGFPAELNDSITPLSVGLHDAISWSKGCYIGQEVIARMDTYDRITRNLVLLECATTEDLVPGTEVLNGKTVLGSITSSTCDSDRRVTFSLANLKLKKSEFAEVDLCVRVQEQTLPVKLIERPAEQAEHD